MQSEQEDEKSKVEFDQSLQNAPAADQHDKSATAASIDTQALWADVGKGMNNLIFQDSNRINNKFQEKMRSLWTEENNNSKK